MARSSTSIGSALVGMLLLNASGLRAMYDRGELRPDADPEGLALALLTALEGGLLLTQVRREPGPIIAGLDAMLAYIRSFAT